MRHKSRQEKTREAARSGGRGANRGGEEGADRGEGGDHCPDLHRPPSPRMAATNQRAALIPSPLRRGPSRQSELSSYRGAPPPTGGGEQRPLLGGRGRAERPLAAGRSRGPAQVEELYGRPVRPLTQR